MKIFKYYIFFILFSLPAILAFACSIYFYTPRLFRSSEEISYKHNEWFISYLNLADFIQNCWYLLFLLVLMLSLLTRIKLLKVYSINIHKVGFLFLFFSINVLSIGFLFFHIAESSFVKMNLLQKNDFYQSRFSELNMLSQVNGEYAALRKRIESLRLERITSENQLSFTETEIKIETALQMISLSDSAEDLKRIIGSVLIFKNFLKENDYYSVKVIVAFNKITGKDFKTIEQYIEWYQTVKDTEEWKAIDLYK
jgi:hypothetical protein